MLKRTHVFAIVLTSGLSWLLLKKPAPPAPSIDSGPPMASEPAEEIAIIETNAVQEQLIRHQRQDQIFQATRAVGLRSSGAIQDGSLNLTVSFEPQETGCQRGDLNIIEDDLEMRQATERLHVTVESLRDRRLYFQKKIHTEQLWSSLNIDIPLRNLRELDMLGVYLCTKASTDRDTCQEKSAGNVATLDGHIYQAKLGQRPYANIDRIFFFQFMAVVESRLMIFDMSRRLNEDFDRMSAVFERLGGNRQNTGGTIRRVQQLVQDIGSVRPAIRTRHVTFYLPHQAPNCRIR